MMSERGKPRVIIFGGTFDPVHNGHLAVARQALQRTGADAVWFVPTGIPHLHAPPVASADDRLALLEAAVDGVGGFGVRDDELRRTSTSFTVDTMRALHRDHPSIEFSILLGADAARLMPRWHRAAELLAEERFLIVNRSGEPALDSEEARRLGFDTGRTLLLSIDSPDVSASDVRRRAAEAEPLRGLVPAAVERLIKARALYAPRPSHA